jgi:hypothetical protein
MGYVLGTSLLLIAVAVCGHCAVRHKSLTGLAVYGLLGAGLMVACAGCVWLTFNNAEAVAAWVANADDRTLGPVASSLGVSGNKASILTSLQGNLRKIGLASGVVLLLQALSLACAAYFGCAARAWQLQYGGGSLTIRATAGKQGGRVGGGEPGARRGAGV